MVITLWNSTEMAETKISTLHWLTSYDGQRGDREFLDVKKKTLKIKERKVNGCLTDGMCERQYGALTSQSKDNEKYISW